MEVATFFDLFRGSLRNEQIPLPHQIMTLGTVCKGGQSADEITPDDAVEPYHAMMECTELGSTV